MNTKSAQISTKKFQKQK